MSVFSLRPYQQAVVDKILSIYQANPKDQRAFLQMPTGTGKTITALTLMLDKFNGQAATVVWTAHQTALIQQSYDDLMELLGLDPSSNGELVYQHENVTIKFQTWQSLRNSTEQVDMLIVDEVHCGSSITAELEREHKSFKKILKLSPIHLYISATPWSLNTSLYKGMFNKDNKIKKDRIAVYSLTEAKKDDFICDVVFNVVQSVDTLEIKRQDEKQTEEFTSIEDAANFVQDKKVNIKHSSSVKKLRQSALYSILDVYFQKEQVNGKLPPTIVFCKTVADGDSTMALTNVVKTINKKATQFLGSKFKIGRKFVDYVSCDVKDSHQKLKAFRDGKINILCVVGMAREGFNYKQLEVAIDLNPSFTNSRLLMQKIGRVVRTNPGKESARYYYLDVLENYINIRGVRKEVGAIGKNDIRIKLAESMNCGIEEVPEEKVESAAAAILRAAEFNREAHEGESSDTEFTLQAQRDYKTKEKKTVTVTEVGFIVSDATNSNPMLRIKQSCLFDGLETEKGADDPEGKKKELIENWFKLGKKPSQDSKNLDEKKLWRSMCSYIYYSGSYDPIFKSKYDRYFPDNNDNLNRKTKEILIEKWFKLGKKPSQKSEDPEERRLNKKMQKYLSLSGGKAFDDQFKKIEEFYFKNKPHLNSKKIKNLTTGEIYNSITEAADRHKRSISSISKAIKIKGKSAGFFWKYLDEEE